MDPVADAEPTVLTADRTARVWSTAAASIALSVDEPVAASIVSEWPRSRIG